MDLRALRYFAAVAETGHMTRAAERLGIQQPPLSLQIKQLERTLGLQLFKRHPRGVTLTEAGRLFQAEALRLLDDAQAMRARMRRVAEGQAGVLRVGFTSSAAAHRFVPDALRDFRQSHPGIELQLREANAAGLTEALVSGRLHAALLRRPVAQAAGLRFDTLLREPLVAALPIDRAPPPKKDARPAALTLARLCQEPLILVRRPGAPGMYADLLALCHAQGLEPRVVAEVDRMMTNLNLVAAGVGASVVPASMAGVHPHAVAYLPLAGCQTLDAPLTLAWRDGEDSLPAQQFHALLLQRAGLSADGGAQAAPVQARRGGRRAEARG